MTKHTLFVACCFLSTATIAQTWEPVGDSLNSYANALQVHNSKLYVGGSFFKVGTNDAYGLAEWDGSAYSDYNSAMYTGADGVKAMTVHDGNVICAGDFNYGASAPAMCAVWDGSFTGTTYNLNASVYAAVSHGNELYVGGYFSNFNSITYNRIAKHNGTSYDTLGDGFNNTVHALTVFGGYVIAGGSFTMSGTTPLSRIARWNGNLWQPLGGGLDGDVLALAVFKNNLYAAGKFSNADGSPARYIAKWNGSAWSNVGGSLTGGFNAARALYPTSSVLYVGGNFSSAGGVSANNVAKWDGNFWQALGPGLEANVSDFEVFQGKLYASRWGGNETNYLYRFSTSVGANAIPSAPELRIYPNPSTGVVWIESVGSDRELRLEVMDITGRIVMQQSFNGSQRIDLTSLPEAQYVLRVRSDNECAARVLTITR